MTTMNYLTSILFDDGAAKNLGAELDAANLRRPLLVADKGLVEAGVLDAVAEPVRSKIAAIFTDTPPNPTEMAARAALELYRASDCDGVVAIGGGSPIDLGKAVALASTHDGPLESYAAINGGVARIRATVAPLIAIPTTAGTGSEVGRGALITVDSGAKLALISPHLIPKKAICDPQLTYGLPPLLTAATGVDALTHCFETYLSPLVNPPAEAIALDGVARAWSWIVRATENGADGKARWHMMMAALQGGLTFQKGLGAVHALSHAAGALREPILHHGMLNGVFLPHVLRFSEKHAAGKFAVLRSVLGLRAGADLARAVHDLLERLRLPTTLTQMGFDAKHIPITVTRALHDHSNATAALRPDAEQYAQLLKAAL